MRINPSYHIPLLLLATEIIIILSLYYSLKHLFKNLYKKETDLLGYKITNFYVTGFMLALYFIIFLVMVIYLRISRFFFALDLKVLIPLSYISTLSPTQRFHIPPVFCIVLLLLIITFLLLLKLRYILIKEIKKLHLYFQFEISTTFPQGMARDSKYCCFVNGKMIRYYYEIVTAPLIGNIKQLLYTINPKWRQKGKTLTRHIELLLKFLPIIVIVILIVWDCYYNNFVITKVFPFMVFLIPYMLWYRITTFLWHQAIPYNQILYEFYYTYKQFVIMNPPEYIENKILAYVQKGLYDKDSGQVSFDDDPDLVTDAFQDRLYLLSNHAFVSTDGEYFENINGNGQCFRESQQIKHESNQVYPTNII